MSLPGEYPAEISSLVDTFIVQYKLNQEVADKLGKCPPGIQWQVISPRPPKIVHKPNGFVMGRIIRATNPPPAALSRSCRLAPVKDAEAGVLSNTVVFGGNKNKVYTPPSSPTHPSPWADWVSASDPEVEKTAPVYLVSVKVRNRSRTPVARRRKEHKQTPAVMDIPMMVLDQPFLAPLEGDGHSHDVFRFLAMPLIILHGHWQGWICVKSKLIIHPGDIVVGKHFEEGWIRTVSIPAIKLKAM